RHCSVRTRSPSVVACRSRTSCRRAWCRPTTSGRSNSPHERTTSARSHERKDDHRHPGQVGCARQAEDAGHPPRARPRPDRQDEHAAPPSPDPRPDPPRPAPDHRHSRRNAERNRVTMRVDDLSPAPGATKSPKRVARGIGGKGGKTAGRGTKGQHSRGRGKVARGFEGGQMPLKQRVPKLKGFTNPFRVEYAAVNLDTIDALSEDTVDPDVLLGHGLVRKGAYVK